MKLRSLIIAIAIGAIAASIVGISAYGWISEHRSLLLLQRTVTTPPATAGFVAKTAPAVISFVANLDDLANLDRLATPAPQRQQTNLAIEQWQQQISDRLHLNYQHEIAPWLGEELTVAIAELDYDKLPQNGAQPGYLAVLSSKNPEVSRQKIQAWWDKQATQQRLKFQSYQGVKIGYSRRDRLASAIVDDRYVVFANHPQVLRTAIDNFAASDRNILDNPDYQAVLAENNHHKIGIGYARLPKLARWLGREVGAKYAFAGINFGVDRQGLISDLSLYPHSTQSVAALPPVTIPSGLISTLQFLPRQSKIALAGKDLRQWRQQFTNIFPPTKQLDRAIERTLTILDRQIGVDLDRDILNWTTGEYALAAIPKPDRHTTDWVFVVERTQPTQVDAAIAHFDELASLAGYNVGSIPLPLPDHQVIGWTKLITATTTDTPELIAKVAGVHTTVDDKYTIVASSIAAMDLTLKAIDRQSLLDSDRYHRATPLLTATATGYLYGNWQTIEPLLPKQLRDRSVVKLVGKSLLAGLPNISISHYLEAGIQRITLLFQVDR
jgi:Protein of unknown function (DUF3352)